MTGSQIKYISIENQSQPRKLTLAQFCNGYPPLPVRLVLMSGVFSWPESGVSLKRP